MVTSLDKISENMDMDDIQLKNVLSRELRKRNLSINALANQSGISSSTLHNWLTGAKPSGNSIGHLKALAKFFNITVSQLLFDEDETTGNEILFSSTFVDQGHQYKITVEKIKR